MSHDTSIQPDVVFVVGSPRSGSTIFGEVLDTHRQIAEWYEPLFIWDRDFRLHSDDVRTEADATPEVAGRIREEFQRFARIRGATTVVDKSPWNSLKMPFVRAVFPEAKFIHLVRDGRDAVVSIIREWNRRLAIHGADKRQGRFSYSDATSVIMAWLGRQPAWRYRLRALWHETRGLPIRRMHLNRLRWEGAVGWGPRFRNWQEFRATHSLIEFCAMQWRACVESVDADWMYIPESHKLIVRYEDLTSAPREEMQRILKFTGMPMDDFLADAMAVFRSDNTNKWRTELSVAEQQLIRPIVGPTLVRMGYEIEESW